MITPSVKNKFKVNPVRLANLEKLLKDAAQFEVAVGFPATKEGLGQPWYDGGASIIDVAIWNNYGMGVPARPFMDLARGKMQELYRVEMAKLAENIRAGNINIERTLNAIGMKAAEEVRKAIFDGGWAPNDPETARRKGSDRPLVDTGEMARRATHHVRRK